MDKQKCYLIGVLCLSFVYGYVSAWAAVAVKGVTGTSFKVEWSPVENAVGYEVSVTKQVVPIKSSYRFEVSNATSLLDGYGILSENVASFSYGIYRYGIRLGDDYDDGYIKLPPVEHDGTYALTVLGDAYLNDKYATLYVYKNQIAGEPLCTHQFYNSDDYYDYRSFSANISLLKGESVLLVGGRKNSYQDEYDNHGRVIICQVDLEEAGKIDGECVFRQQVDAMSTGCTVSDLSLCAGYDCTVAPLFDDAAGVVPVDALGVVEVKTLPCLSTFPLPDSEVAYEDISATSRMSVLFDRPVLSCNPDLISIESQGRASDYEALPSVHLLDSDDPCSVAFQLATWNTCLSSQKHYTVAFADGAVSFEDGTASPAFSYAFTTGDIPSATDPIPTDCLSLVYDGWIISSNERLAVYVYDVMGRLVSHGFVIDLRSLPSGVYVVCSGRDKMKVVR